MKRFLACAFVCLSTLASATVAVSGNLQDPSGTAVSSRAFVRFNIRGCGGNQPRVTGTAVIIPPYQDFTSTAGAISGTIYDSLTEISCGGSVGNTWYGVSVYRDGKPGPEVPYNVTGASFNLNSATPNSTNPVVSAPTGDSTYCRIDAGNCGFTGTVSPSTDNTRDLGSSGANWRTGYFKTSLVFLGTTISTKTGSGALVLGTSPTIATPTIDSPTVTAGITLPATSIADAALSSNVALYNNGSKTWCNASSCTWSGSVGSAGTWTLKPTTVTTGAAISIAGGTASGGDGGSASLSGGAGSASGTRNGGAANVTGGNAGVAGGAGGDVNLTPGASASSTAGRVVIAFPGAGTAPAVSAASTSALYYDTTANALELSENGDAYGKLTRIKCITSQKSESAADTNVLTCTPPAVAGSYRIRFTEAVSAQNTATLGWTATWKDANGSAQAPTNLSVFTSGTAAPALTVTAATNGNYYGYIDIDVDNSATAIVVKTTFAGTSFTSKVTASVERIN